MTLATPSRRLFGPSFAVLCSLCFLDVVVWTVLMQDDVSAATFNRFGYPPPHTAGTLHKGFFIVRAVPAKGNQQTWRHGAKDDVCGVGHTHGAREACAACSL